MKIVLKKPIISEKSLKQAQAGWYTFVVDQAARKDVIKQAVSDQFGVTVTAVRIGNIEGKIKRQRRMRGYFKTSDYKKALVKIVKGQKITLFERKVDEQNEAKVKPAVKEKKSLLKGTKVRIEKHKTQMLDIEIETKEPEVVAKEKK